MSYLTTSNRPHGTLAPIATVTAAFAAQVAGRFSHSPEIKIEAEAAVFGWLMNGPTRADGSPRFTNWNPQTAALALQRRASVEVLARRRKIVRRATRDSWRCVAVPARRLVLNAPRSLWRQAFAVCQRAVRHLETPQPPAVFAVVMTPVMTPAPIVTTRDPSAWDALVGAFADYVAEARARLTARVGDLLHRAALAEAALAAVGAWLAKRARRTAADLPAVLICRTARAVAAQVNPFALWPASLLRAVRRALDHVVTVAVRQTVEVAA